MELPTRTERILFNDGTAQSFIAEDGRLGIDVVTCCKGVIGIDCTADALATATKYLSARAGFDAGLSITHAAIALTKATE